MSVVALGPAEPLAVYAAVLRRATAGAGCELSAVDGTGRVRSLRPGDWCGGTIPGDDGLLHRCAGSTLDVGCGPGRLAGALTARGRVALGIDISPHAVRIARRRGVPALLRDVFGPLPAEGWWRRLLLADGNIGIGGDPERLLRRCRTVLAPRGRILVEVDPPGSGSWAGPVRIRAEGGAHSAPFPWAYVCADGLAGMARAAGLRTLDGWTEAGRWFVMLSRG